MTIGEAIDEIIVEIQEPDLTVTVGRPTIKLYLYEALQYTRRYAKPADYLFFTKSKTFTSSASVNYPSGADPKLESMLYIFVPASTDGQSRLASNREYVTVNLNTVDQGSAANPVSRLFSDHFVNTPAIAGTFFYIGTFGPSVMNTESTEMTTLIPWVFEELAIARTVQLIKIREFLNSPAELQVGDATLDVQRKSWAALYRKMLPNQTFREETPSPAINIAISPNQGDS